MISEIPMIPTNSTTTDNVEVKSDLLVISGENPILYAQNPIIAPNVLEMTSATSKEPKKVKA
ncbi:hypothetical protein D3C75_506360 [compost metagenome]